MVFTNNVKNIKREYKKQKKNVSAKSLNNYLITSKANVKKIPSAKKDEFYSFVLSAL
jgi:hypothetical protein